MQTQWDYTGEMNANASIAWSGRPPPQGKRYPKILHGQLPIADKHRYIDTLNEYAIWKTWK